MIRLNHYVWAVLIALFACNVVQLVYVIQVSQRTRERFPEAYEFRLLVWIAALVVLLGHIVAGACMKRYRHVALLLILPLAFFGLACFFAVGHFVGAMANV